MKHLRKLTALFLAAALALSMAACGGASSAPASGLWHPPGTAPGV